MRKYLPFAFLVVFFLLGLNAFLNSKPTPKDPIYKEIKKYSPYYFEKRFGGLEIRSKIDKDFKEKPTNMEVFHRLEALEKEWGKKHLSLKGDTLVITTDENKTVTIKALTPQSKTFIHNFYGI